MRRIFPAILNGACLFPLDLKRQGIRALVDLVVSESITAFGIGRIRDFTRSFSHQSFPSLRLVSLGGEIVYRRDVELYKKIFPRDCVIGILMSSTEAGNITQFFIIATPNSRARSLRSVIPPKTWRSCCLTTGVIQ